MNEQNDVLLACAVRSERVVEIVIFWGGKEYRFPSVEAARAAGFYV